MAIGLQSHSTLGFIIWTLMAIEIHCTRPPEKLYCPPLCQCQTDDAGLVDVVTCVNSEMFQVPKTELMGLPSIRALIMLGNNLSVVNQSTFPSSMDRLQQLTLKGNAIRSVEVAAFIGMRRLSTLDLSNNLLSVLPNATSFYQPNVIQQLILSGNQISQLDNGSFSALAELLLLELVNNSIDFISANAFHGLEKVQIINLDGNQISQLHSETFSQGLTQLLKLNLENNQISDVAPNTFARLAHLKILRLCHNKLSYASPATFEGLQQLTDLHLSYNRIRYLSDKWTAQLPQLAFLDLSGNPLFTLQQHQLSPAPMLVKMKLNQMPELKAVMSNALSELPSLRQISFKESGRLKYFNPNAFGDQSLVEFIDLEGCNLQSLNYNILRRVTPNLRSINLQRNQWHCDCNLKWLSEFMQMNPDIVQSSFENVLCAYPESLSGKSLMDPDLYQNANCSNATVSHYIPNVSFRLGSTALLECQVEGNPKPEVSWYTPVSSVLHWAPLSGSGELNAYTSVAHPGFHDSDGVPINSRRLQVLRNGNLFISPVETEDAGVYICVSGNSLGNHSVYMSLTLDFGVLQHVKIVSILVGLAVSVAFMLLMLIVQLVQMILNRWGWCCCRAALPPKAKRIRKMLESVEHYKSQQLDRLRDNYNMQVQRIKDNCTQQMEKLRDSYSSQTERLRDFRDYGTHQIDRIRDQYYEQVRRVRDYSAQQMSRVRENYVVQRNRIRKFSAHQLFKLRENYKVQQLHLNKILENLNLESCRTVCARTDSVMFNSEIITMDPGFPPEIDLPQPIPLPSSVSTGSVDIELQPLPHLDIVPELNAADLNFELEEDEDDDSISFQDAMDATEFQLTHGFQDTVIVDPNDVVLGHGLRPSNNIVV